MKFTTILLLEIFAARLEFPNIWPVDTGLPPNIPSFTVSTTEVLPLTLTVTLNCDRCTTHFSEVATIMYSTDIATTNESAATTTLLSESTDATRTESETTTNSLSESIDATRTEYSITLTQSTVNLTLDSSTLPSSCECLVTLVTTSVTAPFTFTFHLQETATSSSVITDSHMVESLTTMADFQTTLSSNNLQTETFSTIA